MMTISRQWIPVGGLLGTAVAAVYAVAQLSGQTQTPTADFTNATMAQVKDAQGEVVLQGRFTTPIEEDGRLERRATLSPTAANSKATGEAEVEFAKSGSDPQEVEFAVKNLPPKSRLTFVIDGTDLTSANTDSRGSADVELDVSRPGSVATR